ncbi:MAG TPA: class I SAM-dependent methyltransferase, partial [Isosphaeraceae bacterium]|nr:class I SAM-dependent methyltransferase [Isosphaeraceae bacterium]
SDSLAIAAHIPVLAVDLDPGMARRALWNARIHNVPHPFLALQARAEHFPIPPGAFVHIDPDRRAVKGSRARSITDYAPGLEFLLSLPSFAPSGAIKLSPASDFETHFSSNDFEIEIISLAGEAREATVWFGSLASAQRRATTLPSGASLSDRDVPLRASLPISPLSAWVYDPDPALSRSGLLPGLARSLGLSALAPGVTLLTGPSRVESPFLTPYRVLDTSPADEKHLRRYVSDHAIGRLDIKPRGLDLTPETLRRRLKPAGPNARSLLLVSSSETPTLAIWAERL